MRIQALFITLFCVGCASSPQPDDTVIVWSKDITFAGKLWRDEAHRRFPDQQICMLVCHGETFLGRWTITPDPPRRRMATEDAAAFLHNLYPDRPVVLICCNEDHVKAEMPPNVYWSNKTVWAIPNDATDRTLKMKKDGTGSIWEFSGVSD